MSTTALSALAAQQEASTASKTDKARDKLAGDMSMFLNMLTTQLKNQDPLSPMDSTEFTNQLVQFAQVEQQISGNENLEKMLEEQRATRLSSAVDYMDKHVEAKGSQLPHEGGETTFAYHLDEGADQVEILIKDALGTTVATLDGDTEAGRHDVTWDGTDDFGEAVDPGVYTVEVVTLRGDATELAETFIRGTVTGVTADEDSVTLSLGDVDVSLEDVRSVTQPPAAS